MRPALPDVALCALPAIATSASLYRLDIHPDTPQLADVSLLLPADQQGEMWLQVQGAKQGLTSQVVQPRYGSQPLVPQGKGWLKPAGCLRVDWQIRFDMAQAGRCDPALQRSLYFSDRPWWLLSESTSLLRPMDDRQARLEVNAPVAGGGELVNSAWTLPDTGASPAFLAIGNVAGTTVGAQGVRVTHVADQPETVWRMGLIALQRRTMAWLAELMRLNRSDRLLVVWLGMDASAEQVSGVSGEHSFVAGYSPSDMQSSMMSLMTLTHEQFHQLAGLGRPHPHPAWYRESLARYYALRALSRLGSRQCEAQVVRDTFIDANRPVQTGLLSLQQRHENGDSAAYSQFYSQGATFWHQLDALLRQATAGRHGLDQDLPSLLNTPTDKNTPLPTALRQQWRALVGPAVDALIHHYLGDNVF